MSNTKRIVCGLLAAALVAAVSLGAFFALAGSNYYEVDAEPTSAVERWVAFGVMPQSALYDIEYADDTGAYITYNQFAQVMQNLMRYAVCERYTHLSGDMYIRRFEAVAILSNALGGTAIGFYNSDSSHDLINYETLADLLDAAVQLFITDERVVDLQGVYPERAVIIKNTAATELVITNVSGDGNIIIVADGGGSFLLSNINTSGDIVVAQTSHPAGITISNSNVPTILALNYNAYISLINRANIGNVAIYNTASINTTMLTNPRLAPSVSINSNAATLIGDFADVHNHVNGFFFFSGRIANLYSNCDLVVIGDGEIQNHRMSNNSVLHVINPSAEAPMDFYAALAAFGDALQEQFGDVIEMLTDPFGPFRMMLAGQLPMQTVVIESPTTTPPTVTTPSEPSHPDSTPIQDFTMTFFAPSNNRDNIPANFHHLLADNSAAQARVEHNDVAGGLFSGNVQWLPLLTGSQFNEATPYRARITLTARNGYVFPPYSTPFGNGLVVWGGTNDTQVIQIEQSSTTLVFYLYFNPIALTLPPNGSNGGGVCGHCGNPYKADVVGVEPQLLTKCVDAARRFVYTANFPATTDIMFIMITQYPFVGNDVFQHAFDYDHVTYLFYNINTDGFSTITYPSTIPTGYYWVYIVDFSGGVTRVGQTQLRVHN